MNLNNDQIKEIVRNIASANLTSKVVADVYSESASASTGEAAVRIIIVVDPRVAEKLKGDSLLNTLVEIQSAFSESGDERLPIVEYATRDELGDGNHRS
jgi:hypothetical protein